MKPRAGLYVTTRGTRMGESGVVLLSLSASCSTCHGVSTLYLLVQESEAVSTAVKVLHWRSIYVPIEGQG